MNYIHVSEFSTVELDILRNIKNKNIHKGGILKGKGYEVQYFKPFSEVKIDKKYIKKYFYGIIQALKCLHNSGYLHLNIKEDNILFNNDEAILSNFGSAIKCRDSNKNIELKKKYYSKPYSAPELDEKNIYNSSVEVFALGITFLSMLGFHFPNTTNKYFWDSLYEDNDSLKNTIEPFIKSKNYDIQLANILVSMTYLDPSKRISLDNLEKHKFFSEVENKYECKKIITPVYFVSQSSFNKEDIKSIAEYFSENKKLKLSAYCLALELYFRLAHDYNDKNNWKKSIDISLNYISQNFLDHQLLKNIEHIGPTFSNKIWNSCETVEELKLINTLLLKGNLLSFYLLIDPQILLCFIHSNYKLKKTPLNDELTFYDYMIAKIPNVNFDDDVVRSVIVDEKHSLIEDLISVMKKILILFDIETLKEGYVLHSQQTINIYILKLFFNINKEFNRGLNIYKNSIAYIGDNEILHFSEYDSELERKAIELNLEYRSINVKIEKDYCSEILVFLSYYEKFHEFKLDMISFDEKIYRGLKLITTCNKIKMNN